MGAQTSAEVQMSEGRQCKIVLLNGQRLDIIVQSKLKTSDLVEITLSHFFVKEQQCFGLYALESNYVYWLDPKKNVLDHEFIRRDGPLTIHLGVKFFLASTCMIADLKAIELFYLQARSNISQGFLVCEASVLCSLAALALQFEHKDYVDDAQFASVLARSQVLPTRMNNNNNNNNQSTADLESSVKQKYKDNTGMSRGEALVNYLKMVEAQPTYGVHFYAVKDKRGSPHWLGISLNGIVVVEMDSRRGSIQSRPQVFHWCRLENIFHNEKKFHFEESKRQTSQVSSRQQFSTTDVVLHSFTSETASMSKCIWTSCVDQHHFYLETTKMKPIRTEVDSLARELDESLSARKQGHHIETFHTERFKQMSEVVQQLRVKRSLLDNMLKDKLNLIRKLEEEETALTKRAPEEVQPDEDFEKKWGNITIMADHYEANKTLSALDEIFKVEQRITVGCYKLVVLHNNTTAKLVHKMVTLQMTKGGDFKLKNPDLRKKWVEMYKSSLEKLKGIEKKVNKYRRLLDMSCVDFASRFEDHKITQRPVSSAQKQMVCRCTDHYHGVLQEHDRNRQRLHKHHHHHHDHDHHHHDHHNQQEQHHHHHQHQQQEDGRESNLARVSGISDDYVETSSGSVVVATVCTTSVNLRLRSAASTHVKGEVVPSPSVASMSSASSSSSSSQHQRPISDSSSSALSSPHSKEPKRPTDSGSLPRPARQSDRDAFVYPEVGHRPVAKNRSYDDLGGRSERGSQVAEADLVATRARDGYDARSIKALSKRYSYKMALECEDDEEEDCDDMAAGDDDDNLYNVSSTRITHVLTRSSSTHQAVHCQHHGHHLHHHRHHHYQQHHYQEDHHHQQQHQQHLYYQDLEGALQPCHCLHLEEHCHNDCHWGQAIEPGTAFHAGVASRDLANLEGVQRQTQSHSRAPSDVARPAETFRICKPPPHRSEKQGLQSHRTEAARHPTLQYVPVEKSPSVTSAMSSKAKASKTQLPASSSSSSSSFSARNHSDASNLASCFKSQRKTGELPFVGEPSSTQESRFPATPDRSDRGRRPRNFYITPPDLREALAKAETLDLSVVGIRDGVTRTVATYADASFMQTVSPYDPNSGGLPGTSLFLEASRRVDQHYSEEGPRDPRANQHLRTDVYDQCMEHFQRLHTSYFSSSMGRGSGRSQEAGKERQPSGRHHCSSLVRQGHLYHDIANLQGQSSSHASSNTFSHHQQSTRASHRQERSGAAHRGTSIQVAGQSQRRLQAEVGSQGRSERPRTASCSAPARHEQMDSRPREDRHRHR